MPPAKNPAKNPTYADIWKRLNAVDVSKYAKNLNGADYLPWMRCWSIFMEHYPSATYCFLEDEEYYDGTVAVKCVVTIGDCVREMFLPVMTGFRNSAKTDPDSRCVGDNKMRCLVKCIAMFGLGSSLYYGELCAPTHDGDEDLNAVESDEWKPSEGVTEAGNPAYPPWSRLREAHHAGSYAFVNEHEFRCWVKAKKGVDFHDLEDESVNKMIDFFKSYSSRDEWPKF